jgi:NADH-quinone oxidoreductase subunit I
MVETTSRSYPAKGLWDGLKVTFVTMVKTIFKPAENLRTVNYPKEKETLVPRARGVIALDQEACTVCMLCARNCPDWCIYIEGHKEERPPEKPGGRVKVRATLDRFDIDYALCMYCGICVEVCPFDALFWSPEYEYSEYRMGPLMHDMDRLQDWLDTVPPAPELEQ